MRGERRNIKERLDFHNRTTEDDNKNTDYGREETEDEYYYGYEEDDTAEDIEIVAM